MALAHQMYPQRTKYFLEAYTAATARPHGYLVIDVSDSVLAWSIRYNHRVVSVSALAWSIRYNHPGVSVSALVWSIRYNHPVVSVSALA
jgi:hypothetical protein